MLKLRLVLGWKRGEAFDKFVPPCACIGAVTRDSMSLMYGSESDGKLLRGGGTTRKLQGKLLRGGETRRELRKKRVDANGTET